VTALSGAAVTSTAHRSIAEPITSGLEICQMLEWDSDFFGCRIARVNSRRLDAPAAQRIREWCASHKINCVYFLADSDDDCTIRIAEQCGFHFIDIRAKFDIDPSNTQSATKTSCLIRPVTESDITHLKRIARESYQSTRFYYDLNFPRPLVDRLYETWIEKSCTGHADAVFVADRRGIPVGYVSCHLGPQSSGHIGLVGVNQECSRMGLGQSLIHQSLDWFRQRGIRSVEVVTQGRNCQAQRLYQRCGFVTRELAIWYHLWLPTT